LVLGCYTIRTFSGRRGRESCEGESDGRGLRPAIFGKRELIYGT